jgi:hypothetical protein
MDQRVKAYIDEVREKAAANSVRIRFGKGKHVLLGDGLKGGGFFDAQTLAVAMNRNLNDWFPIFVHESCHMDQWLEKSKLWTNVPDDDYHVLHQFINTRKHGVLQDRLKKAVNNIVMLEADCERRAYKKIQEYDLPINLTDYARRANSYLYFHTAMYTYGKWYKKSPYQIQSILKKMPTEIYTPSHYCVTKHDVDVSMFEVCF